MINTCSIWSYDQIKRSGYVGEAQAAYLAVFTAAPSRAFSHREATDLVFLLTGRKAPERNSRISELARLGYLRKVGSSRDINSGLMVTRWIYTGRTEPLRKMVKRAMCPHCQGCGEVNVEYYG